MHSRRHRWTTFALIATTALAVGCRGARPLGNLVRITKEQDTDLPEVEAPQQRLAVNKPRTLGDAAVTQSLAQDRNPHVNSLASDSPATASAQTRLASDTVRTSAADNRRPTTNQAVQPGPARSASRASAVAKTTAPIQDMTEEEMAAAFESQPEEVKRMAMQQLVASIKASAEKTSQPAAVDSAIANSVNDLPELPQDSGIKPEIPATRIAAGDHASTAAPKKADARQVAAETRPTAAIDGRAVATKMSDDEDSGLESVVIQSISDQAKPSEVQPVSASRSASDEPMVAQASVVPSLTGASKSAAASETRGTAGEMSEQALYAELLKRLSSPAAGESEADRSSRLIKQRHLLVLSGDPDAAVEKIAEMSESEQEYMRHHLLGLWTMVDPNGHPVPSRRFTTALPQMREATKFAAAATDSLDVRSMAFCTGIESYGQIKTFPGNRFDAGQKVILYCEIENFTVAKTSEGFETHLQGSYDIYNADNEKVVSQLLPADKQISANYLRDYFIAYQMHLPQQLSAGTYRLQLTMEDVGGKKYGQSSIPFEIAK